MFGLVQITSGFFMLPCHDCIYSDEQRFSILARFAELGDVLNGHTSICVSELVDFLL